MMKKFFSTNLKDSISHDGVKLPPATSMSLEAWAFVAQGLHSLSPPSKEHEGDLLMLGYLIVQSCQPVFGVEAEDWHTL